MIEVPITFTLGSSVREGSLSFTIPIQVSTDKPIDDSAFIKAADWCLDYNKRLFKLFQQEELRRKL